MLLIEIIEKVKQVTERKRGSEEVRKLKKKVHYIRLIKKLREIDEQKFSRKPNKDGAIYFRV